MYRKTGFEIIEESGDELDYAVAGGQTLIYYINAYTTLVSAVLGVCFSIRAVIKEKGNNRTNALYMFARSFALTCAAAIPVYKNIPTILIVVTAAMLIVQTIDCIIGVLTKNKMHTVGPFIMAICHAVCLLVYSITPPMKTGVSFPVS